MNRRDAVFALIALGATPLASFAQQQGKVWRVGFLSPRLRPASFDTDVFGAFLQGMRELGYVEGKNLAIEWRFADGKYERLPELAAELVSLKVDVLITGGTPPTAALRHATSTIPIVMALSGDAVATGLVSSLAHPGGNITGSTFFNPELAAKRLELVRSVLPRAKRVAVLLNPENAAGVPILRAMESTAASLKLELRTFDVRNSNELSAVMSGMQKDRIDAVEPLEDTIFVQNAKTIADLALKQRLPTFGFGELTNAGGLISYAVDIDGFFRRAAVFIDKILKGAKPGDIPVEQATKFELIINKKTAKALGIAIPKELLYRADRVIE